MARTRVGILIFNQVEVLDFCGPFEVFSVARLDEEKRREEPSPFEPLLIAENLELVTTTGGMRVQPHFTFENHPPLDILLVPGGQGMRVEIKNSHLISWIEKVGANVKTIAGVCTGSMLLGQAGLLDEKRATTHWKSLDWMTFTFPEIKVERKLNVVEDGNVITSAGIAAGIDLSLSLVKSYFGEQVARNAARHMEYPYTEDNSRRV